MLKESNPADRFSLSYMKNLNPFQNNQRFETTKTHFFTFCLLRPEGIDEMRWDI
jgi:hypothetical protein